VHYAHNAQVGGASRPALRADDDQSNRRFAERSRPTPSSRRRTRRDASTIRRWQRPLANVASWESC